MKQLIYVVFAMLMLASCSSDEPKHAPNTQPQAEPIELSRSEQEIVKAQKDFSVDFFKTVCKTEDSDKNILVSPLSMSMALSMVANGAEGETLAEIINTLGYSADELETVNNLNKTLMERLPSMDNQTTVAIANSFWTDKNVLADQNFAQLVSSYYRAEVNSIPLRTEEGRIAVNSWISDNTRGMITEFLSGPVPDALCILCNALYFAGEWSQSFDEKNTNRATFHNFDDRQVGVSMMHQKGEMANYIESVPGGNSKTGFSVVRKTYGNGAYAMTMVLPAKDETLSSLLSRLDASVIEEWESKLTSSEVMLSLPRFECEYGNEYLITHLNMLGIRKAFEPNAEFSGILAGGANELFIKSVAQKNKVKVDESGTVAASSSVIIMGDTANAIPSVAFDRPFMYYISEQSTGAILFMGCVNAF